MNPNHGFVKLSSNTEVIVAPKVRQAIKPAETSTKLSNNSKEQQTIVPHVCLRNLPELENLSIKAELTTVYMHPDDFHEIGQDIVRIIKIIPGYSFSSSSNSPSRKSVNVDNSININNNNNNNSDDGKDNLLPDEDISLPSKSVYASVQVSHSIPQHHVLLGSAIKSTLNIQDFDIIK